MNRPRLLVKHHMGMGDHIVHNGMVRKIAQDYLDQWGDDDPSTEHTIVSIK